MNHFFNNIIITKKKDFFSFFLLKFDNMFVIDTVYLILSVQYLIIYIVLFSTI